MSGSCVIIMSIIQYDETKTDLNATLLTYSLSVIKSLYFS